jgi:4'-phosphopantetheinyl transferase
MTPLSPDNAWLDRPDAVTLSGNELHVWCARLDPPSDTIHALHATLNAEERERADRFHYPGGREYYIVGRGVLRDILGHYLKTEPARITFTYSSHGKPFLDESAVDLPIRFNLAHSGLLVVYAFVLGRDVGIDIEKNRPDFAGQRIADRFFSPREAYTLRTLPKEQREEGFLNCWTRKEAYIKARGEGLSFPLDAFDVSLKPGEPAALVATQGDPEEAARWSLYALETEPDYAAAVAVEGRGYVVRRYLWRPSNTD